MTKSKLPIFLSCKNDFEVDLWTVICNKIFPKMENNNNARQYNNYKSLSMLTRQNCRARVWSGHLFAADTVKYAITRNPSKHIWVQEVILQPLSYATAQLHNILRCLNLNINRLIRTQSHGPQLQWSVPTLKWDPVGLDLLSEMDQRAWSAPDIFCYVKSDKVLIEKLEKKWTPTYYNLII